MLYSVEVDYHPTFRQNIPDASPEGEACWDESLGASKEATNLLMRFCKKVKHQYSWSDGSLYLYAEGSATLIEDVKKAWPHFNHKVVTELKICQVDGDRNPWKVGCKTLREYMDLEG